MVGVSNFRCKEKCFDLEGYQKGYFHFHVEGKAFCPICYYKIYTDYLRCPCCSSKYRRSRRKDYPHLDHGYIIPTNLVVITKQRHLW